VTGRSPRRRHGRRWTLLALSGLLALLTAVLGALTNIATGLLPAGLRADVFWWSTAVVAAAFVLVTVVMQHLAARAGAGPDARAVVVRHARLSSVTVAALLGVHARPDRINGLPPRDATFTGRDDLLDLVAHTTVDASIVALVGLGGTGKSSLALEYGHRSFAAGVYDVVWWVGAESPLTLRTDLAALASALGVEGDTASNARIATALAELTRRDRWLIIFDDAASPEVVRPWLPRGAGRILLTSRTTGWSPPGKQLDIGSFDRRESLAYLSARTGTGKTDELNLLAHLLGDLPLALAQAAAFVQAHQLPLTEYLARYRDQQHRGKLLAQRIPGYPHSVATTWLIHFADLAATAPDALALLRVCAHLNPDFINVRELNWSSPSDPRNFRAFRRSGGAPSIIDVLDRLAQTSLITRLDVAQVQLHRLVSEVTRLELATVRLLRWAIPGLGRRRARRWRSRCVTMILSLFPDQPADAAGLRRCAQYAPHALAVLDGCAVTLDAADLHKRLALYLQDSGDLLTAHALLDSAVTMYERVEPRGTAMLITSVHLGVVLARLEQFDQADEVLTGVTDAFDAELSFDFPEAKLAVKTLAAIRIMQGRPQDAANLLRRYSKG
jgi:hypothetical protein